MSTRTARHLPAALLSQMAGALQDAGHALGTLAQQLDARLAARKADADGWRTLAQLSDRELRDIGHNRYDVLRG